MLKLDVFCETGEFTLLGLAALGGVGVILTFGKESTKENCEYIDSKGHFVWRSSSFVLDLVTTSLESWFGICFGVLTVLMVYISDFSETDTKIKMLLSLIFILCARVLIVSFSYPKWISSDDNGLSVKKWVFSPIVVPFSQVEKMSFEESRVSIWYNDTQQLELPVTLFSEQALGALRATMKSYVEVAKKGSC